MDGFMNFYIGCAAVFAFAALLFYAVIRKLIKDNNPKAGPYNKYYNKAYINSFQKPFQRQVPKFFVGMNRASELLDSFSADEILEQYRDVFKYLILNTLCTKTSESVTVINKVIELESKELNYLMFESTVTAMNIGIGETEHFITVFSQLMYKPGIDNECVGELLRKLTLEEENKDLSPSVIFKKTEIIKTVGRLCLNHDVRADKLIMGFTKALDPIVNVLVLDTILILRAFGVVSRKKAVRLLPHFFALPGINNQKLTEIIESEVKFQKWYEGRYIMVRPNISTRDQLDLNSGVVLQQPITYIPEIYALEFRPSEEKVVAYMTSAITEKNTEEISRLISVNCNNGTFCRIFIELIHKFIMEAHFKATEAIEVLELFRTTSMLLHVNIRYLNVVQEYFREFSDIDRSSTVNLIEELKYRLKLK